MRKYFAEFLGTLVLVTFGCGIAVVSGCDLVATALAFGLAIVAMAYVIGNISGCHVNPAVSLAMLITKRMSFKDFIFYLPIICGAIFFIPAYIRIEKQNEKKKKEAAQLQS